MLLLFMPLPEFAKRRNAGRPLASEVRKIIDYHFFHHLKKKLLGIFQFDAVHLPKMLFQTLSCNFSAA